MASVLMRRDRDRLYQANMDLQQEKVDLVESNSGLQAQLMIAYGRMVRCCMSCCMLPKLLYSDYIVAVLTYHPYDAVIATCFFVKV